MCLRQIAIGMTILVMVVLTACGHTAPPIDSQQIALTSEDFVQPVDTLIAESFSKISECSLAPSWDKGVAKGFANGYHTEHSVPAGTETMQLETEGWVLSFAKLGAAEKEFDILAEPQRAIIWQTGNQTGERELPVMTIGDESRVFDFETTPYWPLGPPVGLEQYQGVRMTWYRVVVRRERVVVVIKGYCWAPGEPEYFVRLAQRMVNRVP